MPSLLPEVSTSWTSEGVAVRVVTNKQAFCERADRLGITTTIANSTNFFAGQTANYVDGTIIINDTGLSPGTFTCTIVVIDQSGPVESHSTSCQVGVRNGKQSYVSLSEYIAIVQPHNIPLVELY